MISTNSFLRHKFCRNSKKRTKASIRSCSKKLKLTLSNDNAYLREMLKLRDTIPTWNNFFSSDFEQERAQDWIRIEVIGENLCRKYSWAVPDDRALRILAHFSPLIEIGAGKGYWSYLLRRRNVNIVAFDRHRSGHMWFPVGRGGPPVLSRDEMRQRTLFLCYPDEDSQLGSQCLKYYEGEYIIHVGELVTTATYSGGDQAPFGRTSSSQFQIDLFSEFHCILIAELPCFPFARDCISVWKRNYFVNGRSGEEGDYWVDIPPEERLPLDNASQSLSFLLPK